MAAGMLRAAAARGDIRKMQLLSHMPQFDVNAEQGGFTALMAAAVEGQAAALAWLLQHGASLAAHKQDGWRDSALHYAASMGHLEAVKVLLAYGADATAVNYADQTPAQLATRAKRGIAAEFFADIDRGLQPWPDRKVYDAMSCKLHLDPETPAAAGHHTIISITDLKPSAAKEDSASALSSDSTAFDTQQLDQIGTAAGPAGRPVHNSTGSNVKSGSKADMPPTTTKASLPLDPAAVQQAASQAVARGFYGWGTQGTEPRRGIYALRALIVMSVISTLSYLVWRALRTLTPGLWYTCSMPFWVMEALTFASGICFMLSLWYQIERPERLLCDMLPDEQDFPHVDVFIVTYSEPCEVLEPTIIAAINMNYPGAKLTVHVLDDGARKPVYKLVKRLQYQCRWGHVWRLPGESNEQAVAYMKRGCISFAAASQ